MADMLWLILDIVPSLGAVIQAPILGAMARFTVGPNPADEKAKEMPGTPRPQIRPISIE
jgi:hypothetical protein